MAVFVPLHLRLCQHFHFKPARSEVHNSAIGNLLGVTNVFCTTVTFFLGERKRRRKKLKAKLVFEHFQLMTVKS